MTSRLKNDNMTSFFERFNLREKQIKAISVVGNPKRFKKDFTIGTGYRDPVIRLGNINGNIIHIKHILSFYVNMTATNRVSKSLVGDTKMWQ